MLQVKETWISYGRLGLWLVCVFYLFTLFNASVRISFRNVRIIENFHSFFSNPISADTHWWRSLKSPDSFPYHRTTVTDTNSSHLEVESCYKRIWCPTTKMKNVQCGCAPGTTQYIWMLVKKLKKKTLLHHLLAGRNSWSKGAQEVEGWLCYFGSSHHLISPFLSFAGEEISTE